MKIFPYLLSIYILEFSLFAIDPVWGRANWFSENLPIVLIVLALVLTYKKFKFSNLSYIFMFVLIYLHTIGWYYSFANVPFDFITNTFWFERNHFDRIAHFSVWFYAFPFAEILSRIYKIKSKFILFFFPLFFIISIAAIYEIIEWIYAIQAYEKPD
jgi:putative membrane protein